MWGALSDEGMVSSFTIATGPHHISLSHSRDCGSLEAQCGPDIPQALGSLLAASCYLQAAVEGGRQTELLALLCMRVSSTDRTETSRPLMRAFSLLGKQRVHRSVP
jgi:hypothetical protein